MPCGYDAERAAEEAYDVRRRARGARRPRVVAVDAAAYFSRPGPRLVDGLELLAHVLHPDRVPDAPAGLVEIALHPGLGRSRTARCSRLPATASEPITASTGDRRAERHGRGASGAPADLVHRQCGEPAADQAADVAADRDAGDQNVRPRLSRRTMPMPDASGRCLRALQDERRAHQPEHRPRGADGDAVGLEQERTERPGEQRGEVERAEARAPERRLEHWPRK